MASEAPVDGVAPPSGRRRGRLVAIVSSAVALALVVGGGAFAASKLLRGDGGRLPEAVMPASTAAFLRLNLSPGIGQQLKFASLLKKLPAATGGDDPAGLLDDAGVGLSTGELKDWVGDRMGAGIWVDGAKQPVVLAAVAAKDENQARAALTKARDRAGTDRLGFVVADGYALIASADKGSQAAADAAAAQAKQSNLAGDATFRTATAALPADQALLGFADLAKLSEFESFLEEFGLPDEELVPEIAASAPALPDPAKLKGIVVVGAQAVDNGIELRARVTGVDLPASGTGDVRPMLDALPGNSVVAGVGAGLGEPLGAAVFLSGFVGMLGKPKLAMLEPAEEIDLEEFLKDLPPGTTTIETMVPGGDLPMFDTLNAIPDALGAAKTVGVAMSGTANSEPQLRCDLYLADEGAAKKVATDLQPWNGNGATTVQQTGSTVRLELNGYKAADGTLAGSALFKEAMAGMPAAPTVAGYVDVTKLLASTGASAKTKQEWASVRAVGLASGRDGTAGVALVRLVIT